MARRGAPLLRMSKWGQTLKSDTINQWRLCMIYDHNAKREHWSLIATIAFDRGSCPASLSLHETHQSLHGMRYLVRTSGWTSHCIGSGLGIRHGKKWKEIQGKGPACHDSVNNVWVLVSEPRTQHPAYMMTRALMIRHEPF